MPTRKTMVVPKEDPMEIPAEISRIHGHFKQDWRRPFRPIRVRFRNASGVQIYELSEVGQGVFMPYLGKFILVPPGVPRADFYMKDFIDVGFIDELDARERRREAS
jgi:hypothetical protein